MSETTRKLLVFVSGAATNKTFLLLTVACTKSPGKLSAPLAHLSWMQLQQVGMS